MDGWLSSELLERFNAELDPTGLYGGGFGYLVLIAMTLTSTDRTAAWLSRRNWRRLHTFGMHTLWVIFAVSYVPRALIENGVFWLPSVVLIAVFAVRIGARFAAGPRRAAAQAR